jgi:hypothetical protein
MRNVVKGFQFSHLAVPPVHVGKINSSFSSLHNASGPRVPGPRMIRVAPKSTLKVAKRPGKNVAIKGGYQV